MGEWCCGGSECCYCGGGVVVVVVVVVGSPFETLRRLRLLEVSQLFKRAQDMYLIAMLRRTPKFTHPVVYV